MLFTQVATGHCHMLALTRTGHIVAWGFNADGRLLGTPKSRLISASTASAQRLTFRSG